MRGSSAPLETEWLEAETARLLEFAAAARHPHGGFAWLDVRGRPVLERPVETWITARMTFVHSVGAAWGREGCAELAEHGLRALEGPLRDDEHGGWYASAYCGEPVDRGKQAYQHAFVVLAAANAQAAGISGAAPLLDEALEICRTRFWHETNDLVVDEWDRSWSTLAPYRGLNANMHMVEAWLAAGQVTGDKVWVDRALRVTEQAVNRIARAHDWLMPEHFDAGWNPLYNFNSDRVADPFKPYGVTVGHWFEWARLCVQLESVCEDAAPAWLVGAAAGLFNAAVELGWAADGFPGFVYTLDWERRPVVRDRLHWVVCEALSCGAVLARRHPAAGYDEMTARWWAHAEEVFIDRRGGSWWHAVDPEGRPTTAIWDGKPDVYHALQATMLPRVPVTSSLAASVASGLLDT